jgi:aminodeoxyfutalosine deaminase
MSFLKFSGKQLFTGTQLLGENHILTTDEIGVVQEIITEDAGEDIQVLDGIICPGFINAHCHLELSHLKNAIAPQSGMVPFLLQVMGGRFKDKEKIPQAIIDAEAEMLHNGIAAVGDICNTTDTILAKQKGQLYYHNFIEVSGFVPATAATRLEAAQQTAALFQTIFPAGQTSITPHAPYSVSPQLFELIDNLPQNLLTLHNQESEAEHLFFTEAKGDLLQLFQTIGVNIDFFQPTGRSSLQTVRPFMNLTEKQWLLVHNCFTTAADIKECDLQKVKVFFCLCPGANLYIGNPLPDIAMLLQSGIPICLGTDSLASNQQLSILEEMKILQEHYPQLSIAQLLQWATLNGAKALQITDRFGSFEQGKQPGVLVLENVEDGQLTDKTKVKRII